MPELPTERRTVPPLAQTPANASGRRPFAAAGQLAGLLALVGVGAALLSHPPAAIGAPLLAGAALIAILVPESAVAAVLAALPLVFHPVPLGRGSFSLVELATLLATLGVGCCLLPAVWSRARRSELWRLARPWWLTLPAAALLAVATLSLATVADPAHRHESLREYRETIVEPLVFFILARWALTRRRGRELAALAFVGAGLVVAGIALAEVIRRSGGVAADEVFRARAGFPHPNNLAFYLERVGVFAAGWAACASRWRWPLAAVSAVTLAGTAATLSRGAIVGVAAGLGVVVALAGSRRAWYLFGGVLLVALIGFSAVARQRLLATGSGGSESTRLLIWRASLRMGRDHPLFGVGLDQFLYQYERRYVDPAGWPERYTSHPHNIVLDVWLRLGILGGIAFACLTAAVVRAGYRAWRDAAAEWRGATLGAIAALVAGMVHGLVDNAFFLPDLAVMTWLFVALLGAATRTD